MIYRKVVDITGSPQHVLFKYPAHYVYEQYMLSSLNELRHQEMLLATAYGSVGMYEEKFDVNKLLKKVLEYRENYDKPGFKLLREYKRNNVVDISKRAKLDA